MTEQLIILGIAGSLRRGSFNRALLGNVARVLPEGVSLQVYDGLGDLPHFSQDLETDELRPDEVTQLQRLVADAHGLIFATPEYNWSIPGVLKNGIDWASRPPLLALGGKPVGMLSASPGPVGGARAQGALRQVMASVGAHHFPHKGVAVGGARNRLDADGNLGDDDLDFLRSYVEEFITFVRRLAA